MSHCGGSIDLPESLLAHLVVLENHGESILGGGNSNIFGIFIPKIGEDDPF